MAHGARSKESKPRISQTRQHSLYLPWSHNSEQTLTPHPRGPYLRPARYTNDASAEAGIVAANWQKLLARFATIESQVPEEGWLLADQVLAVVEQVTRDELTVEHVVGRRDVDEDRAARDRGERPERVRQSAY